MAKGRFEQSGFNRIICDEIEIERCRFIDDFLEPANSLASTVISKAYWTGGGTSGTQAIVAAPNGIMRLDTTATGSRTSTLTFSAADYDIASNPTFETRIALSNLTNCVYEWGMYVDANDYALFRFKSATSATQLLFATKKNGGTEVVQTLYYAPTLAKYFKTRLEILSDATYKIVIGEVDTKIKSPLLYCENNDIGRYTGSIRSLATFVPYFYVSNVAAAESKKLDIDYVLMTQDRDV
jgi:hypothetical protein